MRPITALLCFGLVGCMSSPFSVVPDPDRAMASLTLGPHTGYLISQGYDGIWSVDGRDIPKGPVQSVLVAPGKRTVGYICPGWISMDAPPTLSYNFEAGQRYELNCENEPRIQTVPDGA